MNETKEYALFKIVLEKNNIDIKKININRQFDDVAKDFAFLSLIDFMEIASGFVSVTDFSKYADDPDMFYDDLTSYFNKKLYQIFNIKNNGELLNMYVNKYLVGNKNLFSIINSFLIANSLTLSKKDISLLLENPEINYFFKKILSNLKKVSYNYADKYTDDYFSYVMFCGFCEKQNIEISESENEKSNNKVLTFDEEQVLFKRYKNGENISEELIKYNMGLVKKVASKYYGVAEIEDLIQVGTIGLLKAMERFDYTLGNKFSTYALNWIRQEIQQDILKNSRLIRISTHTYEKILKIKKISKDLAFELNREPTIEEIADALSDSEENITYLLSIDLIPASLDKIIGDDSNDKSFGDSIAANSIDEMDKIVLSNSLNHDLTKALNTLTNREKDIIIKRFGLYGNAPKTLEEIGRDYNITRERIRQIEFKALRKLRRPDIKRLLDPYLNEPTEQDEEFKLIITKPLFANFEITNNISTVFLNLLKEEELSLVRKIYDTKYKPRKETTVSYKDSQIIRQIIELHNVFLTFFKEVNYNNFYLNLLNNLILYKSNFNIYDYLEFNDKYILENILSVLSPSLHKHFNMMFDMNTGFLVKDVNRNMYIDIANLIKEINYIYSKYNLPKNVCFPKAAIIENKNENKYDLAGILGISFDKMITILIPTLDDTYLIILKRLFGNNFDEKISELTYHNNIEIFNKLKTYNYSKPPRNSEFSIFDFIKDDTMNFFNYMLEWLTVEEINNLKLLFGNDFNKKIGLEEYQRASVLSNTIKKIKVYYDNNCRINYQDVLIENNFYESFTMYSKEDIIDYLYTLETNELNYLSSIYNLNTGNPYKKVNVHQKCNIKKIMAGIDSYTSKKIPNDKNILFNKKFLS